MPTLCLLSLIRSPMFRCTAQTHDLDGGGGRWTRALTDLLVSTPEISSGELWDVYGIDDDIIVSHQLSFIITCLNLLLSHSRMTFHMQTFTKASQWIYYTKLLRAHSRITSWRGHVPILSRKTPRLVQMRYWMTLIGGGWLTFAMQM